MNVDCTITIRLQVPCFDVGQATALIKQYSDTINLPNQVNKTYQVKPIRTKIIFAEYTPEQVFSANEFIVDGQTYTVKLTSHKIPCFRKSMTCVCCGLTGEVFCLESFGQGPHFNLYAVKDGKRILITKDHIVPKSAGGKNTLDNFQTMCFPCNHLKGANNVTMDQLRELKKLKDAGVDDRGIQKTIKKMGIKVFTKKNVKQLLESPQKTVFAPKDICFTNFNLHIYQASKSNKTLFVKTDQIKKIKAWIHVSTIPINTKVEILDKVGLRYGIDFNQLKVGLKASWLRLIEN